MGVDSNIMLHMINKLRANNAIRRSRIKSKKNINTSKIKEKWRNPKISDSELQVLKAKIKDKVLKEKRMYNIVATVLVVLFVILVYSLI